MRFPKHTSQLRQISRTIPPSQSRSEDLRDGASVLVATTHALQRLQSGIPVQLDQDSSRMRNGYSTRVLQRLMPDDKAARSQESLQASFNCRQTNSHHKLRPDQIKLFFYAQRPRRGEHTVFACQRGVVFAKIKEVGPASCKSQPNGRSPKRNKRPEKGAEIV